MFSCRTWLVLTLAVGLTLTGCKGSKASTKSDKGPEKPASTSKTGMEGYPEWVIKGSGSYEGDKGKAIYGVGARSNISNFARLRSMADNAARMEVATALKVSVSRLVKDYFRSVSNANVQQEEQVVQEASKAYTDAVLSGCEIVDHYFDSSKNTMYALAVLDVAQFKKLTEEAKQLPKEVQEHILKNAENAWSEIPDPAKKQ